ncbi:hypothetical protein RSOLAG1IB_05307 [Rhizoctonia solani AG-1 IB]|uniref:Uncharacterized protein n=1 Tax=Thanatephorus cucumeris (strain AG1-IB / isolate 7/3/14) TaxID=1108050 RepID=A0A0B7G2C2_THACB|nr:hypothetical protein RSOLAG1IB_05307 [Rhizoctonia solani AG-1 IB]
MPRPRAMCMSAETPLSPLPSLCCASKKRALCVPRRSAFYRFHFSFCGHIPPFPMPSLWASVITMHTLSMAFRTRGSGFEIPC